LITNNRLVHYQGTVSTGHRKSDLRPSSLGPFWRIFDLSKYTNVMYVLNRFCQQKIKLGGAIWRGFNKPQTETIITLESWPFWQIITLKAMEKG
jgi:hypothetical protein